MTEKNNKVPKREAMSLSIWVCFDEGKKKSQGSLSHVYARGVRRLIIHPWAAATCKEA